MDIRKTLIAVGALAVLFVISTLVYRRFGAAIPNAQPETTRSLADAYGFDPDAVTRLSFAFPPEQNRPTLEIVRNDKFWRIAEPIQARADATRINDLLGAFKTKIRKRVPLNDAEYGLDRPQLTVTVALEDGATKTFLFGDKGVSYSLYMREQNDKDAAIVESYTLDDLSKTPDELRDRNVMQFDPADVTRIEVRRKSGVIAVERANGSWVLKEPVALPANAKAVDKALEALSSLGVSAFLSENVTDFAPFGLANPPLSVTLRLDEGKAQTLNIVDTPTEERRIVVSVAGEPVVAVVAPEFLASLPRTAFDWRDRRITDFQRTETARVEIRSDKGEIVLEKRTGDEAGWFLVRPQAAKADDAKVDDLLFRLDALEATRTLDGASERPAKYGLDRPSLTLTFKGAASKPFERVIRFGKRIGNEVVVASNRSGDVATVPASATSGWTDGAESFRAKPAADEPNSTTR